MDANFVFSEVLKELEAMELNELENLLPGFWDECPPVTPVAKAWFDEAVSLVIEKKRQQTTT